MHKITVKTTRYVDVTEHAKRAAIAAVYGETPPPPKALPPGRPDWPAGGQHAFGGEGEIS